MMSKVLTGKLTFTSSKPPNLMNCTRKDLRDYFENSYDLNESLFTALNDDSAFYKCPDRLRLPLIFYFCHTAVVYVNKLMLAGLIKKRVNFEFEEMFETGVDEMSWDDTENYRMGGSYKWPSVEQVVDYRRNVRNLILQLIEDIPLELPITMESPCWALLMGMEHERIHLETSSVLIRQLPVDMVTKPDDWMYGPIKSDGPVTSNPMIEVEEHNIHFGKPFEFPSYGWDNEYGDIRMRVPRFEASKYLITNRQFLEFIEDGGYNNQDLWTPEGWQWKTYRQARHPAFWICDNGCKSGCGSDLSTYSHCQFPESDKGTNNGKQSAKFRYRAMFDILELPLNWPVDANYHEARAFCNWKGEDYRILTEAEHNVLRGEMPSVQLGTNSDIIYQDKIEANLNLKYGSSTPVNMSAPTQKGFHDVFGNIWEWTEDHFNGLQEFTHFLYDDFSSPCYDGRHNLILGGSWISTGDEASRFARFAFRRHFIQHCGFRVVRSLPHSDHSHSHSHHLTQKTDLPARHIKMDLFVSGVGQQDIPVTVDQQRYDVCHVKSTNTQYYLDTKAALDGILEMEFGFRDSFPVIVASLCQYYANIYKCGQQKAVWFGAGVGRGPFCLSQTFDNIIGADFGGLFIDSATKLQKGESLEYNNQNHESAVVVLDSNIKTDNISFKQFTWIPNEVGRNNMAVVTFLDRATNPRAWLARLWDILEENGIAVIASCDGTWNRDALLPHIGQQLRCICVQEVPYESVNGYPVATVTVWALRA